MHRSKNRLIPAAVKSVLIVICLVLAGRTLAQQPRLILPVGQHGDFDVLFSPDGKRILTNGYDDGTAKLWDAQTGLMLADLIGHKGNIKDVFLTPDGKNVFSTGSDNTVKIWNAQSGDMLHSLEVNKGEVSSVTLIAGGQRALVVCDSANIAQIKTIWDIGTGQLLSTISETKVRAIDGPIVGVPPLIAFSPDGKYLARTDVYNFSQDSMRVLVIDLAGKQKHLLLEGFLASIGLLKYSPDGKTILATGLGKQTDEGRTAGKANDPDLDFVIMLWNAATGKLIKKIIPGPAKNYLNRDELLLKFDGRRMVTEREEQVGQETKKVVEVWDLTTGKILFNIVLHRDKLRSYFFPDNRTLFVVSKDDTARIWDLGSGQLASKLGDIKNRDHSYKFGKDNKTLAIINGKTVKIWDRASTGFLFRLEHSAVVDSVQFGPSGKTLLTFARDNTISKWDLSTGKLLRTLDFGEDEFLATAQSEDDKFLAVVTRPSTGEEEDQKDEDERMQAVNLWDWNTGKNRWSIISPDKDLSVEFSPDSKNIAIYKETRDNLSDEATESSDSAQIHDVLTGSLKSNFTGYASYIKSAIFSPAADRIAINCGDSIIKVWDIASGQFAFILKGHSDLVNCINYSADGKYIISASNDSTARVWDARSGKFLYSLPAEEEPLIAAAFSPDGKYIVTASEYDGKIWNAGTRQLVHSLAGGGGSAENVHFSPDGKYLITDGAVWNTQTGEPGIDIDWHNGPILYNSFSPDNKLIVTASADETAKVWSTAYGELLFSLDDHADEVVYAAFSDDGKKIITASLDNTLKTWEAQKGSLLQSVYLGPNTVLKDIDQKGNKLLCTGAGSAMKIIDLLSGELLYSFYAVGSNDYLVVDKYNRYDGTENARKLLYFTCNDEIIELGQVKDKLWTPGLARRIVTGDSIFAPRLSDLNICGLTPRVEDKSDPKTGYRFLITPRRGGLGETVLFINSIEYRRYKPAELLRKPGAYELLVREQELKDYFSPGGENKVTVKAYTADNSITSRGIELTSTDTLSSRIITPDIYIIMIGVSDYKGSLIDLKYAAKDAADMQKAVSMAARNLLNTDNKEHVFTYKLVADTTAGVIAGNYRFPEKKAIEQTLREIGSKAQAKDILLIFFAGHGLMKTDADKKQFYFLTASASNMSTDDMKEVGISTAELSEWIKPQNLKAQKRVLIFDACASGQALNDFAGGALTVRSDDKSQQVKDIDRLNERSGLFILSASASDQYAYEIGRYNQGLLTYCLLKTIKERQDILSKGRLLNVAGWFNKAKDEVENFSSKINGRQQPQVISNTDFPVGRVDSSVLSAIQLADERPLFARSDFRNKTTRTDNLRLRSLVDKEIEDISARGDEVSIAFAPGYEGDDAYRLAGDYEVNGDEISADIVLIKGENAVVNFMLKGNKSNPGELAAAIAHKAAEWAGQKK